MIGYVIGVSIGAIPFIGAFLILFRWALFRRLPFTREAATPWAAAASGAFIASWGLFTSIGEAAIFAIPGLVVFMWCMMRYLRKTEEPDPTLDHMQDIFR